jgi:hypothetical protein
VSPFSLNTHHLARQGEADLAEECYVELLEKKRAVHGAEHESTLATMAALVSLYQKVGAGGRLEGCRRAALGRVVIVSSCLALPCLALPCLACCSNR